jgi:hypothetical protein
MEKRATLYAGIFDPHNKAIRAAQKAVLEEIYLVDARTWRDPYVIFPEALALEHKFTREILAPEEYGDRPDLHFILCKFRVTAFNDKSPNKSVMKIEASFMTSFNLDSNDPDVRDYNAMVLEDFDSTEKDEEPQHLDDFATFDRLVYAINPISAAWPYWREFVQSMSARMGFPALTVPMLEIAHKEPEKKSKGDVAKKVSTNRKKLSA